MNETPVVVVTGGAMGIGRAIAEVFVERGHHVVAGDLQARDLAPEAGSDSGPGVFHAPLDVTSGSDVGAFFDQVVARHGRLDAVVNNAGIQHHAPIVDLALDDWRKVIEVNLHGVFTCLQAAGRHMLAAGRGAIVNISSLAAIRYVGYPYFAYYATKAAVNQATVALAMQYARQGIRANCIMPGLIDTPLIYKQISSQYETTDDMVAARNAMVPLGHMGTAWDVAAAAVFLASDEARFITGVCLPVDGGQSCAAGGAV